MSSKDDTLEPEELDSLFHQAEEPKDKLTVICLGYLGLRVSELAHMQREWISFQKNKITIPLQQACDCYECKTKKGGVWTPKTEASARSIPFGSIPKAKGIIKSYFSLHGEFEIKSRNQIYLRVKNLAEKAGIVNEVYPHSLRATAALNFAEKGMSAQGLRNLMGWQQLKTAQSYIRHSGRELEKEMERIMER